MQPLIYVDNRESYSGVPNELERLGARIEFKQLQVADYVCSDRVGIERKTMRDFINSIFNQRMFDQLAKLTDSYERPLLLLEGMKCYENVNPNAVRGALACIAIDYGIPIIWTESKEESAAQIYWIAYREQIKQKRQPRVRAKPKMMSLARQQEFLISGLPGISSTRAKQLLLKFKTPEKVFTARESELMQISGIGKKLSKQIRKILESPYSEDMPE